MGKWTKTAGLLFLAASSVYSSRAIVAATEDRGTSAAATASPVAAPASHPADSRMIFAPDASTPAVSTTETTDPFATDAAAAPTTNPAGEAIDTSAKEGERSISSSQVNVSD